MTKTVLILGPSGKIGKHSARAFAARGWTLRHYQRGTDMTAAAMGADVIVNGLNPPNYHNWAEIIPAITRDVIAAARASGATVILPGNVYVFGDHPGTWDETTPHRATSRKGRIRIEMEAAYRASGVPTIVLRAGNFIDPERNGDVFSMVTLSNPAKPRITALGDPDAAQAWVWMPDWAEAAAALAERRAELATFEDVPMPGYDFSANALATRLAALTERSYAVRGFPWWVMRLASPVWELARELVDMRGLYDTPHRLGAAKFDRLLPDFHGTAIDSALAQLLDLQVEPDQPVRAGGEAVLAQ